MIPPKVKDRLPEDLIFLGYRGSQSHGTWLPKEAGSIDDIDLMGVYIAPLEHYLGFGRKDTIESFPDEYDTVCYELRKFVHLLMKNNPNVLSMLWLEPESVLYSNSVWNTLVLNRKLFVSKTAYHSFSGYAFAQLKKMTAFNEKEQKRLLKMEDIARTNGITFVDGVPTLPAGASKDQIEYVRQINEVRTKYFSGYMGDKRKNLVLAHGYDTKNAAHLIRLMEMCIEFLQTGEFVVKRPNAQYLINIKQGQYTLETIQMYAQELFAKAEQAFLSCKFPDQPDKKKVEEILMFLLMERFHISL